MLVMPFMFENVTLDLKNSFSRSRRKTQK